MKMTNNMAGLFALAIVYASSLQGAPVPIDGLSLWLDASNTVSITKNESNVITAWADTRGVGYPVATTVNSPIYVPNGLNGLGYVDFGAFRTDAGSPYAAFDSISTIRTVFVVFRGAGFLLGHSDSYDFHRQDPLDQGTSPLWHNVYTHGNILNGQTFLDGAFQSGIPNLSGNFQIVAVSTAGDVAANRLAMDRTYRSGGSDYAEVLIYNRVLSSEERNQVGYYLQTKWGVGSGYNSFASEGLVMWLDGAKAGSVTTNESSQVSQWADARGTGYPVATAYSSPVYTADGLNAKGVVDFGAADSGKHVRFAGIGNIRTVFAVLDRGNFLLTALDRHNFHDGGDSSLWDRWNGWTHGYVTDGSTYVNGALYLSGRINAPVVEGGTYNIVAVRTTGDVYSDTLCNDRDIGGRKGGSKYAEVLIFNRALSDAEMTATHNYLFAKWGFQNRYNIRITGDVSNAVGVGRKFTHKLDFGSEGSIAVINGITMDKTSAASGTINGYGYSGLPTSTHGGNGGNITSASGSGLYTMFNDFTYGSNTGTLTLTNLVVGRNYVFRFFQRRWDADNRATHFIFYPNGDNGPTQVVTLDPDVYNFDQMIEVPYTADATGAFKMSWQWTGNVNNGLHFYGLVNEDMTGLQNIVWRGDVSQVWGTSGLNWSVPETAVPYWDASAGLNNKADFTNTTSVTLDTTVFAGSVNVASGATVGISGSGTIQNLAKTGDGALELNSSGLLGGTTVLLSGGQVAVGNAGVLGSVEVVGNGGMLRIAVDDLTIGNTLSMPGTSVLALHNNTNVLITGHINSANGFLNKYGTGTLKLTDTDKANGWANYQIFEGTFHVNGYMDYNVWQGVLKGNIKMYPGTSLIADNVAFGWVGELITLTLDRASASLGNAMHLYRINSGIHLTGASVAVQDGVNVQLYSSPITAYASDTMTTISGPGGICLRNEWQDNITARITVNNSDLDVEMAIAAQLQFDNNSGRSTGIQKEGYGSLALLHENNTYTGPTIINAGALVLGDRTASAGSVGSGEIVNNGWVDFRTPPGRTLTVPRMSGAGGGVVMTGQGTAVLPDLTAYTGGLYVWDGTMQYSYAGDTSLLSDVQTDSDAHFVKTGSGTLTATKSLAGNIGVTAGTLKLDAYPGNARVPIAVTYQGDTIQNDGYHSTTLTTLGSPTVSTDSGSGRKYVAMDGSPKYIRMEGNVPASFGPTPATVCLWIRTSYSGGVNPLFSKTRTPVLTIEWAESEFLINAEGKFYIHQSSGGTATSARSINDGQWHLLTFVNTPSPWPNPEMKFYVDGVEDTGFTHAFWGGLGEAQDRVTLGWMKNGTEAGGFFIGDYGAFFMFNRVLSATEIESMAFTGTAPNLVASTTAFSVGAGASIDLNGWNTEVTGAIGDGSIVNGTLKVVGDLAVDGSLSIERLTLPETLVFDCAKAGWGKIILTGATPVDLSQMTISLAHFDSFDRKPHIVVQSPGGHFTGTPIIDDNLRRYCKVEVTSTTVTIRDNAGTRIFFR